MPVPLKSEAEIEGLRHAAEVLSAALNRAACSVTVGVTPLQIDAMVRADLLAAGAEPVLIGRPAGATAAYRFCTCVSVNEAALHAPPDDRPLSAGDLVTIDASARVGGWCADAAISVSVGDSPRARMLIGAVRACIRTAIKKMHAGVQWSSVAEAIRDACAGRGAHLLDGFDGHGIGRELHEPPRCWVRGGPSGECPDFDLRPGMVLAIEPVVVEHRATPVLLADGWTVTTAGGGWACHEEVMVAIGPEGPRVLTRTPSVP